MKLNWNKWKIFKVNQNVYVIKSKQNKTKQTVSRENFITSFSGGRGPMAIVMLTRVILF